MQAMPQMQDPGMQQPGDPAIAQPQSMPNMEPAPQAGAHPAEPQAQAPMPAMPAGQMPPEMPAAADPMQQQQAMQPMPVESMDAPAVDPTEGKPVILGGRFMLPDMTEHPCQVMNISDETAQFLTDLDVPSGVQIVAYLDGLGRLEGQVSQPSPGGFTVQFHLTENRRQKFRERLAWLHNKENGGSIEHRRHDRFEPTETKSHITLPDGRVYSCEVIDISLSGAAVATDVMPALGTYILLGKMRGRVVRYIPSGVAIEFSKQLDLTNVANQI